MNTGFDMISEIADDKFLKKLERMIDVRLSREMKTPNKRVCSNCGGIGCRPRFLWGSDYCQKCYHNCSDAGV